MLNNFDLAIYKVFQVSDYEQKVYRNRTLSFFEINLKY